jgi:hypothetical protein
VSHGTSGCAVRTHNVVSLRANLPPESGRASVCSGAQSSAPRRPRARPLNALDDSVDRRSQWKVASIRSADAAEDKRRERHERKLAEAAEKKLAKA